MTGIDDRLRPLDEVTDWATRAFVACGLTPDDAARGASALVRADARGVRTHGLVLLPVYAKSMQAGHSNPRPDITVDDDGDRVLVDADNALGQIAMPRAIEYATRAITDRAIAAISIRRVGHLGALGVLALQAAEAGFICIVTQNTQPLIGLEGSTLPGIGNNPFAFAVPRAGHPPLVFDAAMSAVSLSRVLNYGREGKPLEEGWALGPDGQPTLDPDAARKGMLLPVGGYKGIAFAMLFEALAGSLSGMRPELAGGIPIGNGAFVLLVNPARFLPIDTFHQHVDAWVETYSDGNPGSRIPGQQAAAIEAKCRASGLSIPARHAELLDALAAQLGIATL